MHTTTIPTPVGPDTVQAASLHTTGWERLCAAALGTVALGIAMLSALPAAAEQTSEHVAEQSGSTLGAPLTAEEFDARTRGKTIEYTAGGQAYGVEEYRPGHKVVWAFEGDECREGDWFQHDDQICFDYHDDTPLQCWTFHDTPSGLMALFQGDTESEPLISLKESQTPLNCPGPDLGV